MRPARTFAQLISALLLCIISINALHSQWSHTPAVQGGYGAALLSSEHYMLIGLERGGIYRSTDDGTTWELASAGLSGRESSGYAFLELGSRVFAATGVGIAVSTDEGMSWSSANNGLPALGSVITGLAVDGSGTIYASGSEGVYHSNDSGATWIRSANGLTDSLMVAIHCAGNYVFACTYNVGIFRSSDGGMTWHAANNGLGSGQGLEITQLTSLSGRLIAATRGGAYYSTDNGDSWTMASSGLDSRTVSTVAAFGSLLVAGTYGAGAYRSTDMGVNWVPSFTGWENGNVRGFCMRNGILFGSNYGYFTLFKSTNNGVNWTLTGTGITGVRVHELAGNDTRIFAANAFGVEMSSNGGLTWTDPPLLFGRTFNSVYTKSPFVFAGDLSVGPYVSTDNGATWDTANGGNSGSGPHEALCITSDPTFLYAGTHHGVYRSSNNGTTWEMVRTGLNDTTVNALCWTRGYLFAGTPTGIYISTDHAALWTLAFNGAPTYHIQSIVGIDSVILAATEYASVPSTYRSSDYGLTWSPVTGGLTATNTVFQTLCIEGRNVFGGSTTDGVWLSRDLGITWTDISEGLAGPALNVSALAVSGDLLYAGTYGGIWTRPLTEVVSVEDNHASMPGTFSLEQNYPNPFNPATTIRFTIAGVAALSGSERPANKVRLAVYDLLGREVAVLVNEPKQPGEYAATWDASGMASGVYFYTLHAGKFVETRKLLLLR
jgi:photosystem II stability/assembly factor-like uncharacterized protein